MSEEELNKRMKIWDTLSNFYLDTELEAKDYDTISTVFINTKVELRALKEIDLYEVFPSLQLNLLSPAGEWAGFEQKWLKEKCLSNYNKRMSSSAFRMYTKAKNALFFWMRKEHWKEIEMRMNSDR